MLERSLDKLVNKSPPEFDKGQGDRRSNVSDEKKSTTPTISELGSLSVDSLAPGAYYWSPGWYGTGQENVGPHSGPKTSTDPIFYRYLS